MAEEIFLIFYFFSFQISTDCKVTDLFKAKWKVPGLAVTQADFQADAYSMEHHVGTLYKT